MSERMHDAVCFDSLMNEFNWEDEFVGKQLRDEWDLSVVATGAGAVVDLQTGGVYRLSAATNATADEARIDWGDIRSLLVTKRASIEWGITLSSVADVLVQLGLFFDANNLIWFELDTAVDGDWHIECTDGGATSNFSSGIAATTNYVFLRALCHTHGADHVHFYIDDVATPIISTDVPDDAGDYLQPYARILTQAVALKRLDLDYVGLRQDR